jgi:CheY-like chemotaxis protein
MPAALPVQGQNEQVLLVDDEVAVGTPLSELIERLGYKVTYQPDPKAALALFNARPFTFDLVLTDLAMPGMTGRDLAKEILRIRPDVPVILLTGMIEPKLREQLAHIGVRAVLTKPATVGELASSIAACLGRPGY